MSFVTVSRTTVNGGAVPYSLNKLQPCSLRLKPPLLSYRLNYLPTAKNGTARRPKHGSEQARSVTISFSGRSRIPFQSMASRCPLNRCLQAVQPPKHEHRTHPPKTRQHSQIRCHWLERKTDCVPSVTWLQVRPCRGASAQAGGVIAFISATSK